MSLANINSHIPSDAEPWLTLRDGGDAAHVVPGFGAKHELSTKCWCHPQVEDHHYTEHGVVVHNVAQ